MSKNMKIGVFDSGLGGLIIAQAFIKHMPAFDYFYYGDYANLPYGDKTSEHILNYTLNAMKYMISQNCKIIVIACNTATSIALRYIQQVFLPDFAPNIKCLGVIVPTVEIAVESGFSTIGVIATKSTVNSHVYKTELLKIKPDLNVIEVAAPELVPLIENNNLEQAEDIVRQNSNYFKNCDGLILGCTHYPLLKKCFINNLPTTKIISQDEFIAQKLQDYLERHGEICEFLAQNGLRDFKVTSFNDKTQQIAKNLGIDIKLTKI